MNEDLLEDKAVTLTTPSTPPPSASEVRFGNDTSQPNIYDNSSSNRILSPRMREEDADLLESMHYASSQVSQYTPDGTPLLRPKDRSLPMEDVPLISMPIGSTSQLLMKKEDIEKTAVFNDRRSMNGISSMSLRLLQQQLEENNFGMKDANLAVPEIQISDTTCSSQLAKHLDFSNISEKLSTSQQLHTNHSNPPDGVRRLLSGEIRTVPTTEKGDSNNPRSHHVSINNDRLSTPMTNTQEEETNETERRENGESSTLPVPESEKSSGSTTEEEGMAERRRVSEAIQFAQAVGEQISLNRDDLCIIDDDEDDDDDDDDDDDGDNDKIEDNTESKERVALNTSFHEGVMSSAIGLAAITPKKSKAPVDQETPIIGRSTTHSAKYMRRKARPMWPFEQHSDMEFSFMNHLSDGSGDRTDFVYKGICANPPEITKRGIQRGNYAQLHRKAWLEVSDKYHRYGKNLRLYYRLWERLGFPTNKFFDWLDSKGEAAGQPLPNIEECPRSVLDSDTVLYITNPNVTERYALNIIVADDGRGRVVDVDEDSVHTGPDGWIFILRDNVMYGAPKVTSVLGLSKQRFHHSSFFGGKAVASAGIIITDNQGYLTRLYPHSGHYRPGEAHMQRMLFFLHRNGVDLRTFEMDTQQLLHVSREKEDTRKKGEKGNTIGDGKSFKGKEEKKMKKVDSLHLEMAVDVACFLAHKADFIGKGLFDKIHRIRKADVTSVSEALNLINGDEH